jgi:hypothetical protein
VLTDTEWGPYRDLTVKLRGRTEAPHGAEGAQSLSARDAKPQAHHGPLQRLLDVMTFRPLPTETSSFAHVDA